MSLPPSISWINPFRVGGTVTELGVAPDGTVGVIKIPGSPPEYSPLLIYDAATNTWVSQSATSYSSQQLPKQPVYLTSLATLSLTQTHTLLPGMSTNVRGIGGVPIAGIYTIIGVVSAEASASSGTGWNQAGFYIRINGAQLSPTSWINEDTDAGVSGLIIESVAVSVTVFLAPNDLIEFVGFRNNTSGTVTAHSQSLTLLGVDFSFSATTGTGFFENPFGPFVQLDWKRWSDRGLHPQFRLTAQQAALTRDSQIAMGYIAGNLGVLGNETALVTGTAVATTPGSGVNDRTFYQTPWEFAPGGLGAARDVINCRPMLRMPNNSAGNIASMRWPSIDTRWFGTP